MSYRIRLEHRAPEALRAVAAEQLADAVEQLSEAYGSDPVEAVHEARKDLKKTRSALRLARPGLKGKAYRKENRRLRDTGRALSGARDADVLVETVDKLAERFSGRLPKRSFTALRDRFAAEAAASRERAADDEAGHAAVLDRLREAEARVADWPLDGCDRDALLRGAQRAYARGRDALARAGEDPSVERLHEWRKRVKDLWYHQRLLGDAWPKVLKAQAKEAHRLSDLLGDDHDLAVLADALTTGDTAAAHAPIDEEPVLDLIAERRAELQAEAFALGRHLYAEKPKPYRKRLAGQVRAARAEPRPVVAA